MSRDDQASGVIEESATNVGGITENEKPAVERTSAVHRRARSHTRARKLPVGGPTNEEEALPQEVPLVSGSGKGSVKAPSVKAPSAKAPSVKAPSAKAPSVKAPSSKKNIKIRRVR